MASFSRLEREERMYGLPIIWGLHLHFSANCTLRALPTRRPVFWNLEAFLRCIGVSVWTEDPSLIHQTA